MVAQWVGRRSCDQKSLVDSHLGQSCLMTLGMLFTLCVHAAKQYNLVQDQWALMICGWEGNRGSGIVVLQILLVLSSYGLKV